MNTMRQHHITRYQLGVTLVELMVAMLIGLFLLGGVIQIFQGNKATYRLQEGSANVQEGGRFAQEFISRDLRMAGMSGCSSSVQVLNHVDPAYLPTNTSNYVTTFGAANAIRGISYDSATFPTELTALGLTAANVIKGTDAIIMQQAAPCPGADVVCHNNDSSGGTKTCANGQTANSAELKIADNSVCNIGKYDIVLITDCTNAEVFSITNNPNGSIHDTLAHGADRNNDPATGNPSPKLKASYGEGSSVYRAGTRVFYIGMGAAGQPSLFRCNLFTSSATCGSATYAEELVEGVYDMVVEYGEDTDGDKVANRYVTTGSVTNWGSVVSARVTASTRSIQDNVLRTAQTYPYNGANVTDRRLRHDFTFTIAIRNRL